MKGEEVETWFEGIALLGRMAWVGTGCWLLAKGDEFRAMLDEVVHQIADKNPANLDALVALKHSKTGAPIGDTDKNLKSAIDGETYEYSEMYPGFRATAEAEGNAAAGRTALAAAQTAAIQAWASVWAAAPAAFSTLVSSRAAAFTSP